MTRPSETTVSRMIVAMLVFVGLAVVFGSPQANLAAGVVRAVATGMVPLCLRGRAHDVRNDESPGLGPLLRLAKIDYDPRYDHYLGVLLFVLSIAAFVAFLIVDPSGWNALLLVDVGSRCLIAVFGAVVLSDR